MRLDQLTVQVAPEDVELKKSWTRESIAPEGWLIPLPSECVAELDEVAATVRATPRPVDTLDPADFSLRACTAVMASVRAKLETDTGLAVVDRFPVERYSHAENLAIGWLLAAMLGQVVAQKTNGTRLYDVKDSGQALGYGVRRSVTNLGQPFHTDGGWLWKAPAFVGLFCLESAMEGGLSRFASLVTAHHELRRTPARPARAPLPRRSTGTGRANTRRTRRASVASPSSSTSAGPWPRATTRTTSQRLQARGRGAR